MLPPYKHKHACAEKVNTADDVLTAKPSTSSQKSRVADVDPRIHLTTASSNHVLVPSPPPGPCKHPANVTRLLSKRHRKLSCCADTIHEASCCADFTHQASCCADTTRERSDNVRSPRPPSEARCSIRPQRKICRINVQRHVLGSLEDVLMINRADVETASAVFLHARGGAQCSGTDGTFLAGVVCTYKAA